LFPDVAETKSPARGAKIKGQQSITSMFKSMAANPKRKSTTTPDNMDKKIKLEDGVE